MIDGSMRLHNVAHEWAERCAPLLSHQDWQRVREAIGELHDQLREDVPDETEFDRLFSDLVAGVIDRLGSLGIESWAQAQVYRCSANGDHRARATSWMQQHRH
jgi:hypothetical protein